MLAGLYEVLSWWWYGAGTAPAVPRLHKAILAGPTVRLSWADTLSDESGFSIESRDQTAAGAFAEIATAGPGGGLYDDVGPFTADHIYQYRLVVVGGAFDGEVSNVVTAFRVLDPAVTGGGHVGFRLGLGL